MRQMIRHWPAYGLLLLVCALSGATARAQGTLRITYPQEGQEVRGEITVRYEGVPEGGYVMIKVDGQFKQASSESSFALNTFDQNSFPKDVPAEGKHSISLTAINAGGKRAGQADVSFVVANTKEDVGAEAVTLTHFTRSERLGSPVQRYRIFAESNASIEGGAAAGGGASGGGAGGASSGGASAGAAGAGSWLPAPLDWQVSALVRRVVRDVDMVDGAANLRSVVQEAQQRQRLGETGGAGGAGGAGSSGGSGAGGASSSGASGAGGGASAGAARPGCMPLNVIPNPMAKGPWNADSCGGWWETAPELGQYFVKMIQPSGQEINATRKSPTIALADLLPTFPPGEVHPGSTWDTTMTFLGDLSSRLPVNVRTGITFTSFETVTTPAGAQRRSAKLESFFRLPADEAIKIATRLAASTGGAGGAGGGSGSGGGAMPAGVGGAAGASGATGPTVSVARTRVWRNLWFDVASHKVLRSEDRIETYFEEADATAGATGGAGGAPGATGGAEAAPAEPTKVTYNLRVTTWLDDQPPPPTVGYTAGAGTAHARDSVQDPSVSRVMGPARTP